MTITCPPCQNTVQAWREGVMTVEVAHHHLTTVGFAPDQVNGGPLPARHGHRGAVTGARPVRPEAVRCDGFSISV